MAQRILSRMYDDYGDAQAVVHDLEASGIPHDEISILANADAHGRSAAPSGTAATDHGAGAKVGAVFGTALGGGAGLLAGIGALAIPGVGPVVAAGWLVATLAGAGIGAASGGLVGSLTSAGVSRDEANVYAEGVKRGGSLVTVRVEEAEAAGVEAILARRGSADWQQRRDAYGSDWSGFNAAPGGTLEDKSTGASGTILPGERTSLPGDRAAPLPGERTTAMPDDRTTPLPGERTTAMPGDRATPLPGERTAAMPNDRVAPLPGERTTAMPDDRTTPLPGERSAETPTTWAPGTDPQRRL